MFIGTKTYERPYGDRKVDQLSIIVSGCGTLCVPKLSEGTGKAMSAALMDAVFDWGVVGNINTIRFDTASSNTGKRIGACTVFQHRLGRNALHLDYSSC